jgi:hypothetical protein
VVCVDPRCHDDIPQCDVVLERPRDAREQQGSRAERVHGPLGQHGGARVALTGEGDGDLSWAAGQVPDLEERPGLVAMRAQAREVRADRLVLEVERGQHEHGMGSAIPFARLTPLTAVPCLPGG